MPAHDLAASGRYQLTGLHQAAASYKKLRSGAIAERLRSGCGAAAERLRSCCHNVSAERGFAYILSTARSAVCFGFLMSVMLFCTIVRRSNDRIGMLFVRFWRRKPRRLTREARPVVGRALTWLAALAADWKHQQNYYWGGSAAGLVACGGARGAKRSAQPHTRAGRQRGAGEAVGVITFRIPATL